MKSRADADTPDPARRELLYSLTGGVLDDGALARCRPADGSVPNVVVLSHEGQKALFHDDLVRNRTVLLQLMSIAGERQYPVLENLAQVQALLGDRLGREVFMLSVTVDPLNDTPRALAAVARRLGAKPGWSFLTGEAAAVAAIKDYFFHSATKHVHSTMAEDCSRGVLRYGNAAAGLWGSAPARAEAAWIVERLSWMQARTRPDGPSRRRGPAALGAMLIALLPFIARAQHPHPQPQLAESRQVTIGDTTTVTTGESLFLASQPFADPPGTNLLPTVYTNNFDSNGVEIPNTLPSTPTVPYNLHEGRPVVSTIDRISPTTDLARAFERIDAVATKSRPSEFDEGSARTEIQRVIDILEGNPIENRAYSGFPLLHYTGPLKAKKVQPILDANGAVIGGNVDIHQIWFDNHIESDTSMLDPSAVQQVPWTITYTLDVLDRGRDDFSPFAFFFDAPPEPFKAGVFGKPNVGMDQTFFPMEEGTRTVLKLKMPPAKYFSLSYTWGWRWHPPRVQVTENLLKKIGSANLLEWETGVFGVDPRADEPAKLAAIAKIGDLAPPKIIWRAMREARRLATAHDWKRVASLVIESRLAFDDWKDRTRLPRGVPIDPDADLTLFYANNTIHGQFTDGGSINFPRWQTRGTELKVTLRNGDYFDHAYMNVDFGGGRGWENQFKSSVKVGGSGCWFTFGRNYVNMNLKAPVTVPAAVAQPGKTDTLGLHKVHITYNFDPSRRLRFYQFDPTHHDVAVFSIH